MGADVKGLANISDVITRNAERDPDGEALLSGRHVVTWGQLDLCVDDATAFLDGHGIGEGEPVGIALGNSVEHVILLLALLRMGAAPLEIPPDTPPDAMAPVLTGMNVRVLLCEFSPPGCSVPVIVPVPPHWRPSRSERRRRHARRPADLLELFILSSGSTGAPKPVPMTQGALFHRVRLVETVYFRWWSPERPGTFLLANPIGHSAFLHWFIQQTVMGGRTVLLPQYLYSADLVRAVAEWDDAILRVVPNACRLFLRAASVSGPLLPGLRLLNCTGQPLFEHEKREILRRVTPNFTESLGAAGCGPISFLAPEDMAAHAASVGRVTPGVELRVRGANGAPSPAGSLGRLEVRSPGMAARFLLDRAPGNETEGFHDGWYRTGDVGRIDGDGILHIAGRAADRIRQGDEELYPTEIEAALSSYPGITEVAVVGYRPPGAGSDVAVAIVGGLSYAHRTDVAAHCATLLPAARRPRCYLFSDRLPQTATGKVDRPAIRDYLAANPPSLSSA